MKIATLIFSSSLCALCAELNVTVSAVYRPVPGEVPGELGPNEFTAGSRLYLKCLVQGYSGELSYRWSVSGNPSTPGCTGCDIDLSSTTSTLTVGKPPLYSYYAGVYTCNASEAGRSDSGNSANFTVTVVGEHVPMTMLMIVPYITQVLDYLYPV